MRSLFSTRRRTSSNMMSDAIVRAAVFLLALTGLASGAGAAWTAFSVLDEVYPFTPPGQLLEEIDGLLDTQENVCIAVMPVYQNTDYPAFTEFAAVLQYAEKRGCRILIRAPLIQKARPAADEVAGLIRDNIALYEGMSVHPRGVLFGADSEFPELAEVLGQYFPVFTLQGEEEVSLLQDWTAHPVLYTEDLPRVRYQYGENLAAGQFDYHRNVIDDISVSLEGSNHVLLAIVCAAILIFSGMMVYARRLNYKQFIGDRDAAGPADKGGGAV